MAQRRKSEPSDSQVAHALYAGARDYLLKDKAFSERWLAKHPLYFRGTIAKVKPDGSAAQVIRAGQTVADPIYYPVYATMYVPVTGHDALLAWTGPKQAIILAIRGAGEPNNLRIATNGGSLQTKDSRGLVLSQHADSGHKAQYRKDGKRIAHQQTEDGQHQIIGQQWIAMPGGKINLGAPLTGGYHVKGHDPVTNTYQHRQKPAANKSEKLVRQHSPAKHVLATKKASGKVTNPATSQPYSWVFQPDVVQHPDGHSWGDDGSGTDATAGATPQPIIADPTEGPALSALAGNGVSGLPAGSYTCGYTLSTGSGETALSPTVAIAVDQYGSLSFPAIPLAFPATAVTFYASTQPDGSTLNKVASTNGAGYTMSALPTSGITPPTTNTTQTVADPTTAPTLGTSTSGGGGGTTASGGGGFGLLLGFDAAVAASASGMQPGTFSVGYAFTTAGGGTTRISPLGTIKVTSGVYAITVSGLPALPATANGVNYYLTPLQSGGMMTALRYAATAGNTNAVSFNQLPTSSGSWPSVNTTGIATPTSAPAVTANAAATPSGLPAGTANLCLAWSDGAGHLTSASPTASVTIVAGGGIAFGPEDVPQNAQRIYVYMSAASGGAFTGSMFLLDVQNVTGGGTYSATYSVAASSGAAGPPSGSTMPTAQLGQLAEKHGPSGHWVKKYDGKNQYLYANGLLHQKLCAAKNTFFYNTLGTLIHVQAATGDKHHIGDHYHGYASNGGTGALSEAGCVLGIAGPYLRHTRDACDNAHSTYVHDGTSEKLIKTHGPTKGHTIHAADGTVQHHHAVTTVGSTPKGSKHHTGDHVHNADGGITVACDGTVTLSGNYQRKTVESDGAGGVRYAHYHQTTKVRHHHPTSGEHAFHFNGTMHMQIAASGNGAKSRHKQHGTSSFHEVGDDGSTGKYLARHANGAVIHDHDGMLHRIWGGDTANNGIRHVGLTTDGYAVKVYDGGQSAQESGGHPRVHLSSNANAAGFQPGAPNDPGGWMGVFDAGTTNSYHALHHSPGIGFDLRHSSGNIHLRGYGASGQSQTELWADGNWLLTTINTSRQNGRGDGGVLRLRAGTGFHHQGDHGNGEFYSQHAGGTVMMTHDNTTHKIKGAHGTGHATDGNATSFWDNGQSNADGGAFPQLILSSAANAGASGGGGGLVRARRYADTYTHTWGAQYNDTHMHLSSVDELHLWAGYQNSRAHIFQIDSLLGTYGQQNRYGDDSGHIKHVPQGWSGVIGSGALSKDSVSNQGGSTYTTGTASVPQAPPGSGAGNVVPNTQLGGGGQVAFVSGDSDYSGHHSKIVGINVWYGSSANHRHHAGVSSADWGYGARSDGDNRCAYANLQTHGDAGVNVYGATMSGPNWQGNITITYHRWN